MLPVKPVVGIVGTHDELHEDLFTDSDHAGCPFTRRSTSGAISILTGNVTHWPIAWSSNLQKFVTRCSAEAEGVCVSDRRPTIPVVYRVHTVVYIYIYIYIYMCEFVRV